MTNIKSETRKKPKKIINVQPLKTMGEIEEMKMAIKRGDKGTPKRKDLAERDVLIFLIGINTGLRASDLVRIKVNDVANVNDFYMIEQKSDKKRKVNLIVLEKEINTFIQDKSLGDYLFQSQKGNGHITTTQLYRILESAGKFLGRKDIGTHTMRKTFGYHHYKRFKDVALLQEIFNHSSPSITRSYIGITQEEIDDSLIGFRLG